MEMNENSITKEALEMNIKDMIYTIRGLQVMLDSDLAKLYQCANGTKSINLACKRNSEKFPERYRFQITKVEYEYLRFQNETLKLGDSVTPKYLPYVFTEQGVAMLATVLKTSVATEVSIGIMDAFVAMRHYILENRLLIGANDITRLALETNQNTKDIIEIKENMATKDDISRIMDNFIDETKIKEFVFVDGQKFEADEAYINIYKRAKKTIFVLDDYISIKTLSHLKYKNNGVNVVIFSDNKGTNDKLRLAEYIDFNKQYPSLEILATNTTTHDRLIVIDFDTDNEEIFLCGASSKDAGGKLCFITKLQNNTVYKPIIEELLKHNKLVLA